MPKRGGHRRSEVDARPQKIARQGRRSYSRTRYDHREVDDRRRSTSRRRYGRLEVAYKVARTDVEDFILGEGVDERTANAFRELDPYCQHLVMSDGPSKGRNHSAILMARIGKAKQKSREEADTRRRSQSRSPVNRKETYSKPSSSRRPWEKDNEDTVSAQPRLRPRPPSHSPPRLNAFELLQDDKQPASDDDKQPASDDDKQPASDDDKEVNPWRRDRLKKRERKKMKETTAEAVQEKEQNEAEEQQKEEYHVLLQEIEPDDFVDEIMPVPESALERVLGIQGSGIREIEEFSSTSIKVHSLEKEHDGAERALRIRGPADSVAVAKTLISEKMIEEPPIEVQTNEDPPIEEEFPEEILEQSMDFPKLTLGRLAVQQRLRDLAEESGTKIEVDENAGKVCVRGDADSIVRAIGLISDVLDEEGVVDIVEKSVEVPREVSGRIIGKGGENIKKMRAEHPGVQIDNDGLSFRIVGPSADVTKVFELIHFIQAKHDLEKSDVEQGPPPIVETMEVPPDMVGYIIGKGGSTVKQLHTESGAKIKFDKSSGGTIQLSGSIESVALARTMITDLVAARGESSKKWNDFKKKADFSEKIEETMEVAPQILKRIFGKEGKTIMRLQKDSGASIQVDRASMASVAMIGSRDCVLRARELINNWIEHEAGREEDSISVTPKMIESIFGNGAQVATRLQKESGARMEVGGVVGGSMVAIVLRGSRDSISRVKQMISQLMAVAEVAHQIEQTTAVWLPTAPSQDEQLDQEESFEQPDREESFASSSESHKKIFRPSAQAAKSADTSVANAVSSEAFAGTEFDEQSPLVGVNSANTEAFTQAGTMAEVDQRRKPSGGIGSSEVDQRPKPSRIRSADQEISPTDAVGTDGGKRLISKLLAKGPSVATSNENTENSSAASARTEIDQKPKPSIRTRYTSPSEASEVDQRPKPSVRAPTSSSDVSEDTAAGTDVAQQRPKQRPKPLPKRPSSANSAKPSELTPNAAAEHRPKPSVRTPSANADLSSGAAPSTATPSTEKRRPPVPKAEMPSGVPASTEVENRMPQVPKTDVLSGVTTSNDVEERPKIRIPPVPKKRPVPKPNAKMEMPSTSLTGKDVGPCPKPSVSTSSAKSAQTSLAAPQLLFI